MVARSHVSTLEPARIASTAERLADRVHERFPDRGLAEQTRAFAVHARGVVQLGSAGIAAPVAVRIASWVGGVCAVVLVISPFYVVETMSGIEVLPVFLQSLSALFTVLAATVAGFFTMRRVEQGLVRRRALAGLAVLSNLAHVTDMLQISKSPTKLLFPQEPTPSSEPETDDAVAMSRYLAYCGELYALIAKVAVLYGEWTADAEVLASVHGVCELCSDLESKSTQKILLLEQLNQRVRAVQS
jgi:hypothetical protein